ncbi:hypothetical protein BC834DRAFT_975329 [Gloeopeniophorella convolvens]|nr:hypothetical protein BC834DRAFT_975329 [Gloeopeniophorella convolvens]
MTALVNDLLGAFFIGIVLSSIVYGITWLQVYSYYTQHSSHDGRFLKGFVALLLGLDTLHLALICHGFYIAGVTNFGDFLADLHAPWSLVIQAVVGVLASTCIQQFYATRIYQLSQRKNVIVPLVISALSVMELGFSIAFVVRNFQVGLFTEETQAIPFGASALGLEVACGIFITASMVYYILQQRTNVKRTNRALHLLTLYIVNSGALNLLFATTCLITYVRYAKTLIYAPFFFILVRLYACSFMTILNSRDHVRERLGINGEGRTVVTITREQVTDMSPLTTFKLSPESGEHDDLPMLHRHAERRRVEKAVGRDSIV